MRSAKMSVSETILSSQSHRRKNGAAGPLLFSAEWLLLGLVALISLVGFVVAMPLATVVHGGHHLVDVFGGVIVFSICLYVMTRLLPEPRLD